MGNPKELPKDTQNTIEDLHKPAKWYRAITKQLHENWSTAEAAVKKWKRIKMTVTQMQTEAPCKISPPGGFTDSKKGTQEEPE